MKWQSIIWGSILLGQFVFPFTNTFHRRMRNKLSLKDSSTSSEANIGTSTKPEKRRKRKVSEVEIEKSSKDKDSSSRRASIPTNPASLTYQDKTGYLFRDGNDMYDVPFVEDARWYRILVRKNSEKTLCELFQKHSKATIGPWYKVMFDSFYPKSAFVKYKGKKNEKELTISYQPMVAGLLLIKTKMNPEVADMIEATPNVRGFVRDPNGLVLPLTFAEEEEVEKLQAEVVPELSAEVKKLKIGEYVSIIGGRHEGKYGIIEGTSNGRIEVRLRNEYKDNHDSIDLEHLRYLENPPEKNYKTMSAKDAVESLMRKEPNSEMLRFLRKEGLLRDILNSRDEEDRRNRSQDSKDQDFYSGRDGGKSLKTISKTGKSWSSKGSKGSDMWNTREESIENGKQKKWQQKSNSNDNEDDLFSSWNSRNSEEGMDWNEKMIKKDKKTPDPVDNFDDFIEQMLNEADSTNNFLDSDDLPLDLKEELSKTPIKSPKPRSSGHDFDEVLSLDWLEEDGAKSEAEKDKRDSEQVLDDLIKELSDKSRRKTPESKKEDTKTSRKWSPGALSTDLPWKQNENKNKNAGINNTPYKRKNGKNDDILDLETFFDEFEEAPQVNKRSTATSESLIDDEDNPDDILALFSDDVDVVQDKKSEKNPMKTASTVNKGNKSTPSAEDFESFDDYMDALVSFQQNGDNNNNSWNRSFQTKPTEKKQKSKNTLNANSKEINKSSDNKKTEGLLELTKDQLKQMCRDKNLKVSGTKNELVQRITESE